MIVFLQISLGIFLICLSLLIIILLIAIFACDETEFNNFENESRSFDSSEEEKHCGPNWNWNPGSGKYEDGPYHSEAPDDPNDPYSYNYNSYSYQDYDY